VTPLGDLAHLVGSFSLIFPPGFRSFFSAYLRCLTPPNMCVICVHSIFRGILSKAPTEASGGPAKQGRAVFAEGPATSSSARRALPCPDLRIYKS
jgi:hypothetical protein